MTCKEFEELSGSFALGAVTPEERQQAQAHLAECAACARLYQELRSVVAVLPLSVPQVDPPASLKERVLASIKGDTEPVLRSIAEIQQVSPRPIGRRARKPNWATRLLVAAAVLLFALLGGVTFLSVSLEQQLASASQQLAHAQNQLTAAQRQLNDARQQLSSTKQQLTALSPRLMSTLSGDALARGATGQMFYLPQENATVMIVHGLPKLSGAHVYQGWLLVIKGNQITSIKSVGVLTIEGNTATVSFPGNATNYNAAAISLEPGPAASKRAPAGPVIAKGFVI